jgi:hypothetical protein
VNTQQVGTTTAVAGVAFLASLAALIVSILVFFIAGHFVPSQSDPYIGASLLGYVPPTNIWTAVTHASVWVGLVALPTCMVSGAVFAVTKPALAK